MGPFIYRAASVPAVAISDDNASISQLSPINKLADLEVSFNSFSGTPRLGELKRQHRVATSMRRATESEILNMKEEFALRREGEHIEGHTPSHHKDQTQRGSERATEKKKKKVNKGRTSKQLQPPSAQERRKAVTELIFQASVGDLGICQRIVEEFGIEIADWWKTCDYDKRTPLHLAAGEGHFAVVEWLLAHNANPNAVDRFKRTPLEEAVTGGYVKIIALLIQHGAQVAGQGGNLIDLALSPLSSGLSGKGKGGVVVSSSFAPDWSINASDIKLLAKMSEGSNGILYKARWRGTIVAVKHLTDSQINLGDMTSELNNIYFHQHPNTVQLLGAVLTKPYMLVFEFQSGGSVSDVIGKGGNFSQWRSLILAMDLVKGLDYLHHCETPIVHGDLQPKNLLLGGCRVFNKYHRDLSVNEIGCLKISNYGLTKTLHHSITIRQSFKDPADSHSSDGKEDSSEGLRYQAPEVYRRGTRTFESDVYSFGMILYHLFEASPPFSDLSPKDAAEAASRGLRPSWGRTNLVGQVVPSKVKVLVQSCWHPVPTMRCKIRAIISALQEITSRAKASVTARTPDENQDEIEEADDDEPCCSCLG